MPVNDPFSEQDPRFAPFNPLDHEADFSQPDEAAKDINDFLRELIVPPAVPPKKYEGSCAPIHIRNYQ